MLSGFGRLSLSASDRVLVLSPHPDDEALGCGGLIQRALREGAAVRLALLTYGDERVFRPLRGRPVLTPGAVRRFAEIRHRETIEGARTLGLTPEQIVFLGYPDREVLRLWLSHWRQRPALRNPRTKADRVPYESAFRPGAPYRAEELLADLRSVIAEFKPTKVFVSHPADEHGDHRALHLFTRVALWDLEPDLKPELLPYLIHYRGWPHPRGYHPAASMNPPEPLFQAARWLKLPLDEHAVHMKRAATQAHRTQWQFRPKDVRSAIRHNELFGDLPAQRLGATGVYQPFLGGAVHATGIDFASVSLREGALNVRVRFAASMAAVGGVALRVYGYKPGTPFPEMPKLHLVIGKLVRRVRDIDRALPSSIVKVRRSGRDLEVAVPLPALGDPDRFLLCAQATVGGLALGRECWRVAERAGATHQVIATRPDEKQ